VASSQISLRILKIVGGVACVGSLLYQLVIANILWGDFQKEYNESLTRFVSATARTFDKSLIDRKARLLALAHDFERVYRQGSSNSDTDASQKLDKDEYWRLRTQSQFLEERFRVDIYSSVFIPKQLEVTAPILDDIAYSGLAWGLSERSFEKGLLSLSFISESGFIRTQPPHHGALMSRDFDPRQSDLFLSKNFKKDGSSWQMTLDPLNEEYVLTLTQVVNQGDQRRGVLVAAFDVPYSEFVRANKSVSHLPIKLVLADSDNRVLASSFELEALSGVTNEVTISENNLSEIVRGAGGADETVKVWSFVGDGDFYVAASEIENSEWRLIGIYPDAYIDQRLQPLSHIMLLFLLAGAILAIAVSYLSLQRSISQPLRRLLQATQKIPGDNWNYTPPKLHDDEVGEISGAIGELSENLRRTIASHQKTISSLDAMSKSLSSMYSTLDASGNMTAIMEPDWQLIFANETCLEVFDADPGSGDFREIYRRFFDQLPDNHFKGVEEALASHGIWQNEIRIQLEDEEPVRNFLEKIFYQISEEGDIVSIIYNAQALYQSGETSAEIQRLAYYDHLTGLQNRTFFKGVMEKELHALNRSESMLALLYIDLDNFKTVNDSLGHDAGDELLLEAAKRLQECLRNEDAVARLGGDEFAILLTDVHVLHYVSIVANKILQSLNKPMHLAGQLVEIQASIGVTVAPHDGIEVQDLMKNADLAMYQAKEKGKNNFRFFTRDMNQQVSRRLALEHEIKSAIENHEFVLFYQPKVHLKTGSVHAAEALIRWPQASGGFRNPADFIPAAEDCGLIDELGVWILKTACQQAKTMYKALRHEVVISVNVSARQLINPNFVSYVSQAIHEVGLKPSLLELEITESLFMSNLEQNIQQLNDLRDLGVRVSIDDFGTGYSSLSYLKRLPIDQLKVDRSFIMDLPDDEDDRVITELIISMAQRLSLEVVAEGVETQEQYKYLASLGCEYIQGYYFSRPLPADEFMIYIFETAKKPRGVFEGTE
jgi:diguanylate cyclase (GGDEF)-like protein